jgi:hypothetical protein
LVPLGIGGAKTFVGSVLVAAGGTAAGVLEAAAEAGLAGVGTPGLGAGAGAVGTGFALTAAAPGTSLARGLSP